MKTEMHVLKIKNGYIEIKFGLSVNHAQIVLGWPTYELLTFLASRLHSKTYISGSFHEANRYPPSLS